MADLAGDRIRNQQRARTDRLLAELRFWRNLAFLLPYGSSTRTPVIPRQRTYRPQPGRPVDLWPIPRGVPSKPPKNRRRQGHL